MTAPGAPEQDWQRWPEQPPRSCIPDLMRGLDPFSVVAVWLHRGLADVLGAAAPFLARALRQHPNVPRERVALVLLQPAVNAVFQEWLVAQPREVVRDLPVALQRWGQFCADCVNEQLRSAARPDPSTPPSSGLN